MRAVAPHGPLTQRAGSPIIVTIPSRLIHRSGTFAGNAQRLRRTARGSRAQEHPMLDIVMLALGLGFFVAGIGYAYACERL